MLFRSVSDLPDLGQWKVGCFLSPVKFAQAMKAVMFWTVLAQKVLKAPQHLCTSAPQHLCTSTPRHLSSSAPQHLCTSDPQHLRSSAPLHLSSSAPLHFSTSAPQHLCTSAPLLLSTFAPQLLGTSAPQLLSTSAPQHLCTSAPQHLSTSAPQLLSTSAPQYLCPTKLLARCDVSSACQVVRFVLLASLFTCPFPPHSYGKACMAELQPVQGPILWSRFNNFREIMVSVLFV